MAQPSTQAFASAIVSTPQAIASKVEVWTQPTASVPAALLTQLGHVTSGGITDDETATLRRTCSLTLADDTGRLTPSQVGDLLHPDSNNELRVYRGLYLAGVPEWIPLGVYRISKPTVTFDDNGLVITVSGYDRMKAVQRARWVDPYTVAGGNLATAVRTAMTSRFPGLTYNLSDSGFSVPTTVFGTSTQNDPAADLTGMATAAGQELFFDAQGTVVLRTVPDPATIAPQFTWAEGPGCTVSRETRDFDESRGYNTVVVTGAGAGSGGPWRSVAQVSPVPSIVVPYFFDSPLITSQAMADATSASLLLRVQHSVEEVGFDAVPDPRANAGDVASLTFGKVKASAAYALQALTVPLDAATVMNVTCRPRQGAQ